MSRRGALVAALLVLALGLRVAYVEATSYRAVNDAGTYNRFASTMARHGDYETGSGPGTGAGGSRGPTAYFPPAYPYLLAAVDLIDGHASGHRAALPGERLAGAALGTLSVGLIGLVALELCGAGPALAALGLAGVYPVLIELSGVLVAENLLIVFMLAATWAGLRAGRAPPGGRRWGWIAGAGVLCGLATLAHENAALVLLPLGAAAARAVARGRDGGPAPVVPGPPPAAGPQVVGTKRAPSARFMPSSPRWRGLGGIALLCACAATVIAPWTIRNAVELHHFVPVSDETGITLRGTYNPASAADRTIPWKWRFFWDIPADQDLRHRAGTLSEVALGDTLEHRALRYISDHPSTVASVGWHNLRRIAELEGAAAWRASAKAVDLPYGFAHVGVVSFWIVGLLALAGLFTRALRRPAPRWPWAIPVLFLVSVVFVNVETPRFREPIDPFLLVLAGCAVSAAVGRLRSSRS